MVWVWDSEGQRLLHALCEEVDQCVIAKECGVDKSTVSRWHSAEQKPLYPSRKRLAMRWKIGVDTWDETVEDAEARRRLEARGDTKPPRRP